MAEALWLYGVAGGDLTALPRCPGVHGGHDATIIRHAGLAAIVSEVPLAEYDEAALREKLEDLDWLEGVARGHERVLDAALQAGAVVPSRICTIYETADGVRDMLTAARPSLEATLARLKGTAEWGLKAYLLQSRPPRVEAAAGAPSSGVAYLTRKREERAAASAAREATEAALQTIHGALRAQALETVVNAPREPGASGRQRDLVLSAAYLVADDARDAFRSSVTELVDRYSPAGFCFELTGPWPAYHFARIELSTA
jgi:hypothetical protein